ncbi:Acyl carrier protein [wastewater metagenome]|uniref:Acyl carrier protein n=2 Tax=unclassified sequences TaxID=12908 RepID=A0A5B8RGW3_9ZZZZ|nr:MULTISPECIES: acyl carrier protein [Arhodomonas]MCS4503130.1 acyl carrier protein [Arhodomonas aquaeolei]QEA05937.1 acyl carrier protein [uncultured organism]
MNHSYQQILETLTGQIRTLAEEDVTIGEDTDLLSHAGLDSVNVMDLVMQIEDEFDVVVPVNALADIRTPGQLAALIQTLEEDA